MHPFTHLTRSLLADGAVALAGRPVPHVDALPVLRAAFADAAAELAGPPLAFDAETALAAAGVTLSACWFLLDRTEPAEEVSRVLVLSPPRSAAAHLSADVSLRYLPMVLRRARLLGPADALPVALTRLLGGWPLSGVLAEVAPADPFAGSDHVGVQRLFVERCAALGRADWIATEGPLREWFEFVRQETV